MVILNMPLTLHCKRFFLTYPRCDVDKEEALRLLRSRETIPFHHIIGRERHEDGEHHLHVYLEFTRQKHLRDERHFDLNGHHPNIQTVRNPSACQAYCIKDGDYIADMDILTTKRTYGEIIAGSSSAEEFLVAMEEVNPYTVICNLQRLEYFANKRWPRDVVDPWTVHDSQFVVPELLDDWYTENVRVFEGNGDEGITHLCHYGYRLRSAVLN